MADEKGKGSVRGDIARQHGFKNIGKRMDEIARQKGEGEKPKGTGHENKGVQGDPASRSGRTPKK